MADTPPCVAVAYSGGRDSTALLHAVARAAQDVPGLVVVALHVHHGLSPQADAWLDHARCTCAEWAGQGLPVRLMERRVQVDVDVGDSIEAKARQARYTALSEMAADAGANMVLLAHHRRDQAETLLLQALRGGGVAGLAAMPKDRWRDGVRWVRPWLDHPRQAIEAYVAEHGLRFIEDNSNADPRFARNRLRLLVWPALEAAFPHAELGLAVSARRVSDALQPLRQWADQAVASLTLPPDEHVAAGSLDLARWAALPEAERRETLRHWYQQQTGQALRASWVERLTHEVPVLWRRQGAACWPHIGLQCYRGRLHAAHLPSTGVGAEVWLDVTHPGDWPVPSWGGVLQVRACDEGGVSPSLLRQIQLRCRQGGERFQLGPMRPARSLKKQFQAVGVPDWARQGPLVFAGPHLVLVPGLGLDARVLAPVGAEQWTLNWVPLPEPLAEPSAG